VGTGNVTHSKEIQENQKTMKEHRWLIQRLEVMLEPESNFSTKLLIRALLVNTDRRRKVKHFTVVFEPGQFTLSAFADLFREGQKMIDLQEGKRPCRNKHPKVDERQMEMFGGDYDQYPKKNLG
jgi:hypothetical protein